MAVSASFASFALCTRQKHTLTKKAPQIKNKIKKKRVIAHSHAKHAEGLHFFGGGLQLGFSAPRFCRVL
jgi:hypothetical protein